MFFNFLRTSLNLLEAANLGEAPGVKPWGTVIVSEPTLNESPCLKPTGTVTFN